MDFNVYTSRELYATMYDKRLEAPSNFFLSNFFPKSHFSTKEEIMFEKIPSVRKLAPFVLPTDTGKPIFKRLGSTVESFKPAYIKPKDAVRPVDQINRQPGDLFTDTPRTPAENFDAEVAKIVIDHKNAIWRTWEWMAAQAVLYAGVNITYADGVNVLIDFKRDAGHSITKASDFWDDTYDILADIQLWGDRMAAAAFGGIPNRLFVGTEVWSVMRKNKELMKQMDTQVRGNDVNLKTGLVFPTSVEATLRYVGTLGAGLEVWVYNDFYVDATGTSKPFMNPKDILLVAPGVDGVRAYGAILDKKAGLQPTDIFPKQWDDEDPSATYIMSQSAPLMIPVNPNRTLRARVLPPESA